MLTRASYKNILSPIFLNLKRKLGDIVVRSIIRLNEDSGVDNEIMSGYQINPGSGIPR